MKHKLIVAIAVVALLLTSAQPAFAAKYNLNIHNDTEDGVKIRLEGPDDYSFTVEPGKTYKTVEEGDYEYSYTACGEKVSGDITVEDDEQWLIIDPCPEEELFSKFVVDSHLPNAVTLSLSGPQEYELSVELGTNKFVDMQTGDYFYSYDACDGTLSGSVRITKNGKARITLKSCEVLTFQELSDLNHAVNLRIGSHYAFPVSMTIIGPESRVIPIQPGLNRLNVIAGDYEYFYTAFGRTYGGTFSVGVAGFAMTVSPLAP